VALIGVWVAGWLARWSGRTRAVNGLASASAGQP